MGDFSPEDLNYFAASLDAEGCFYGGIRIEAKCVTSGTLMISMSISNTDREWLEWFLKFGGHVHRTSGGTSRGRLRCKPTYQWTMHGASIIPILNEVIPYLKMKGPRARVLLKLALTIPEKRLGMRTPKETIEYRKILVDELKSYNRKGQ